MKTAACIDDTGPQYTSTQSQARKHTHTHTHTHTHSNLFTIGASECPCNCWGTDTYEIIESPISEKL